MPAWTWPSIAPGAPATCERCGETKTRFWSRSNPAICTDCAVRQLERERWD